jgi:hypothetical protein
MLPCHIPTRVQLGSPQGSRDAGLTRVAPAALRSRPGPGLPAALGARLAAPLPRRRHALARGAVPAECAPGRRTLPRLPRVPLRHSTAQRIAALPIAPLHMAPLHTTPHHLLRPSPRPSQANFKTAKNHSSVLAQRLGFAVDKELQRAGIERAAPAAGPAGSGRAEAEAGRGGDRERHSGGGEPGRERERRGREPDTKSRRWEELVRRGAPAVRRAAGARPSRMRLNDRLCYSRSPCCPCLCWPAASG